MKYIVSNVNKRFCSFHSQDVVSLFSSLIQKKFPVLNLLAMQHMKKDPIKELSGHYGV